jgi:hypothetical protein
MSLYDAPDWDADWAFVIDEDVDGGRLALLDRRSYAFELVVADPDDEVFESVVVEDKDRARKMRDEINNWLERN